MVILLVAMVVALLFSLGTVLGAPYLPTRQPQSQTALGLLRLKAGQTVLDLGSGDGSFLLVAARQGIRGIGYEINPLLVIWSKLRLWRYRRLVKIYWGNYWNQSLPAADGIYVFLIKRYMRKLDRKLSKELPKSTPIASFAFTIPGKRVLSKENGIYLYRY